MWMPGPFAVSCQWTYANFPGAGFSPSFLLTCRKCIICISPDCKGTQCPLGIYLLCIRNTHCILQRFRRMRTNEDSLRKWLRALYTGQIKWSPAQCKKSQGPSDLITRLIQSWNSIFSCDQNMAFTISNLMRSIFRYFDWGPCFCIGLGEEAAADKAVLDGSLHGSGVPVCLWGGGWNRLTTSW